MSGKYPANIVTAGAPAGYSVYFDGTGDYLQVPDNAAFQLGSGNFTIEAWVNLNALPAASGASTFISKFDNASQRSWLFYFYNNAGTYQLYFTYTTNGTTNINPVANLTSLSANTWYHVAAVRSGTNLYLFLNGVQVGSTYNIATDTIFAGTYPVQMGLAAASIYTLNGYLSNVRVVKGTALYTTTFTPPTQLFNITNTSLLTCNSPAFVDQGTANSGSGFTITANGDVKVSTFTPFTGYSATPPNANTQSNTSGIWTVSEAEYWMAQNQWPMPYPRQSLRFNSADSARLTRTNSVTGNQKTMTFSFWMKRTKLGTNQQLFSTISGSGAVPRSGIGFTTSDTFDISFNQTGSAWIDLITTQVFRDVSSWYHLVIAIDTTQATSSNRVKLYVNGSQVTAFGTAQYPTQNADLPLNWSTYTQYLGSYTDGTQYADMYGADWTFVDGLALDSSYFGQTDSSTGAWIPQNYTGNYGTNGFRLTFQNNTGTTATTLGKDWSGKGNNWTPANFSVSPGVGNDSLTDSPWNFGTDYGKGGEVRGNYCTFNSVFTSSSVTSGTLANGNLDATVNTTSVMCVSTFEVGASSWYVEAIPSSLPQLADVGLYAPDGAYIANYLSDGKKSLDNVTTTYGATYAANDVIGIAVNGSTKTVTFYKNNVSQGAMTWTGTYAVIYIGTSARGVTAGARSFSFNFGQRLFAYPAPSGYKALCTTNLPTPAIGATSTTLASKNMNIALYTGNGTSQAVTGYSFQPDLVWFKARTGAARNHVLFDGVRGANKALYPNLTNIENTWSGQSFLSDGFTVDATFSSEDNASTISFVGWGWKGGNGTVSNTNGTVTSTVSANPTAGISVVTYATSGSACTVGHGLGAAPAMIILKNTSGVTDDWYVYHTSLGNTKYLVLDTTAAAVTAATWWNSTSPTSTVFSLGSAWSLVKNFAAYCFAPVAGFSSFGTYTGNGSADGPFVYLGFRPRFIMLKRTDTTGDWNLIDTSRNPYNAVDLYLYANTSAAEGTYSGYDILSNGFKLRNTGTNINASGGTYIYAAFAETPFNYSRAR